MDPAFKFLTTRISPVDSAFKFSEIRGADFNPGTAHFILQNIGALELKSHEVVVQLVVEICQAYLSSHFQDVVPPNYTPPPTEPSPVPGD